MTAKMFNPANQLSVVGLPQCPTKYRDHKPIGKFHLRVLSRTLHYNLGLLSFHQPSSVKNEKKETNLTLSELKVVTKEKTKSMSKV